MSDNPYLPPPGGTPSIPVEPAAAPAEPHVFSPPKLNDLMPNQPGPTALEPAPKRRRRPRAAGTSSISDRLQLSSSGMVYDVLRDLGHTHCVLPPTIRPIADDQVVAGEVFTISGHKVVTADIEETTMAWSAVLSRAPVDSVVVCQPHDAALAHFNEMSAETFDYRGVRGYIVDGGCRDVQCIKQLGFPVWCKYFAPVDFAGRWVADVFGEPINIGGIGIRTGDYVVADFDGVVVIPRNLIQEVLESVESKLRSQTQFRKSVVDGSDPQQMFTRYQ